MRDFDKADLLVSLLHCRLQEHVTLKINDEDKRSHWCFKWASANFARLSALAVFFDIVQDDLRAPSLLPGFI